MCHPCKDAEKTRVSMQFRQRYFSDNPAEVAIFKKSGLWGKPHLGIDFAPLPEFKSEEFIIVSPPDGIVIRSGFAPDYGFHVRIKEANGYVHILAHLKMQPIVKVGQMVEEGDDIGYMGSTGNSSGVHLHYEVRNTDKMPPPPNCRLNPSYWCFEGEEKP